MNRYRKWVGSYCANCGYCVYVPMNTKAVTCIKCRVYYCVKCSKRWHLGVCDPAEDEAYWIFRLEKWLAEQDPHRVRRCPICKTIIVRDEGCKFIKCKSDTCQGKVYFCIGCGKVLKEEHESHPCEVSGRDYKGWRIAHKCELM